MSYKHLAFKIPRALDKRVKLSPSDKMDIQTLYKNGVAIREIARRYEGVCSRRLIQFIIFPERKAHGARLFKERRKDGRYYNKNKWRLYMRTHRRYKQKLYLKGQLVKK